MTRLPATLAAVEAVVVQHRFGDAPAGDQVGDHVLALRVRRVARVLDDLGHAQAQLADLLDALALARLEVAVDHAFLRMPQAVALGDRDHLVHLVDVQVAAGAVVGLEQRRHGLVPAAQHAVLARVGRVEVDARLGAADGRAGDGELDLHRLGQRLDLAPVEPLAHARAAAGGAAAQRVDDDPALGGGLGVVPLEDDLGGLVFEAVQQFFMASFGFSTAGGSGRPGRCSRPLPALLRRSLCRAPLVRRNRPGGT